jgi:hypothetical protein
MVVGRLPVDLGRSPCILGHVLDRELEDEHIGARLGRL